ncbi:MAG: transglutaminase-like cysteine peptidase [Porticoccus sp.]
MLEQPEAARNLIIALHKITTRKFRYILDRINYRKSDYWATPFEMLKNGGGDTEDFVLFEKDILLSMGFPSNNLILVMYQDLNLRVVGMGLIVDLEEQGQFS